MAEGTELDKAARAGGDRLVTVVHIWGSPQEDIWGRYQQGPSPSSKPAVPSPHAGLMNSAVEESQGPQGPSSPRSLSMLPGEEPQVPS